MKKIVSMLLAIMMIIGMLPMGILSASAAEVTETVAVIANEGTLSSDSSSISWTSGNITFTSNKSESSTAIRTSDSDHFRLYTGNSVTITCTAGNITKIVVTATTEDYATVLATSAGAEASASGSTVTIVPTASASTYTIAKMTAKSFIKTVTVSYSDVDASTCAHSNTETVAAVDATCTTAGNTAGVKCSDCGTTISGNETIAALGHTETSEVTDVTCTTDGYTTYTCSVCGNVRKSDWVDAAGHIYVDGVCTCGTATPADLAGEYYIAAIRSSGNYYYLTNEVNTSSRYVAVDSGLTELPTSIETKVDAQVFELIFDATTYTYKIKTGDNYLGWTSGNVGALVAEAEAIAATVDVAENGAYNIRFSATDKVRYLALNNNSGNDYFVWYGEGQADDLYLIPVSETAAACEHTNTTTEGAVDATCTTAGSTGTVVCSDCGATVTEATEIAALGHTYVEGVCSVCGEAELAEDVKIVFELGDNGTATHNDGSSATTYSETVNGYTLNITDGTKMYTGARDATGNGCIKLGTSSVVGGFSFTVPDDVTEVVICIAKYKAKTTKVNVNGTEYTLTNSSDSGTYDEITVDTSTSKTVSVTTVSGACRAMVNSITFICSETDHTCVWGEGVVTTAATCTTDGVMTYTCTVDGCTKTEPIEATGHSYTYTETAITCANCDYSATYTLSTIAEAKAYTDTSLVYYVKGIVTYVNNEKVYIEDSTGGILVMFTSADAAADIALGDEILVWDCLTTYNGLIETTYTLATEYVKVSSGNALPSQTVTIADLTADTTNEYLAERVVIENVTIGTINTSGNTELTDANGNSINIYKVSGLNEAINANDVVTVTAIVSTYNGYQLLVNPGTAAADVVEVEHHDEVVISTVTIAEAKAGTTGEYYQVEGTVTYISGRNVYIQDATGGIVVYLTASAATTAVGDKVKAYGALTTYNGLIELTGIDETNTEFYEILSSGNTVEAQNVTIADLMADTTNEYLAEKITLTGVYVSHYSYSSSYGNVSYYLVDGNGNELSVYRVTVASEEECVVGGSIVTVEAVVSSYNGYQLVTTNDKITVTGTCAHETTEIVNATAATCTATGYTGDTACTVCTYYVARGEDIPMIAHTNNGGTCSVCSTELGAVICDETSEKGAYATFAEAYAAYDAEENGWHYIKLLTDVGTADAFVDLAMDKNVWVDLNWCSMYVNVTANGYTIYGMDNSTDTYDNTEEYGYLVAQGATVAPVAANLSGTNYLAIDVTDEIGLEGYTAWSFHAYTVKLTYVTLDPTNDALGYRAQICGDEMVLAKVTGFGFHMGVEGGQQKTYSKTGAPTNGVFTLRLKNIMASNGGEMSIDADAFVIFGDTETASQPYSTTMKATILKVNELWASYDDAQKTATKALYTQYSTVMDAWFEAEGVTNNIAAWTPSETTV